MTVYYRKIVNDNDEVKVQIDLTRLGGACGRKWDDNKSR